MNRSNDHSHDHPHDEPRAAPELRGLVERLDARGRRLRDRAGLTDRVLGAVQRELEAPVVVARLGPPALRRWSAMAAALVVVIGGLVVALMLRGDRTPSADAGAPEMLVVADASSAERLLVALVDPSRPSTDDERQALMEEILPGSTVQLDELDQELRRIIGSSGNGGGGS